MELSTVIGVLIVVVAVVLIMKVFGKIVSLALSVLGIIAVVWLVVVGLRWMDEADVRDNFLESNNLFLLEDEGSLITGFATHSADVGADLSALTEDDLTNPNSPLYDEYYKVVVVQKDALPEKTALLVEVADAEDRTNLFQSYVDNVLLEEEGEDDLVERLVEAEEQGDIEVHKETLAFKHGVLEVLR